MGTLTQLLLRKEYHDVLALLKGFRSGIVYGVKIRFPHATVMTFLFRDGSLRSKIEVILKATYQHAWNLGRFVFLYKSFLLLFRKAAFSNYTRSTEGSFEKQTQFHTFLAGCVAGYLIFGTNNPVNQQIVLYLFSRVSVAIAKYFLHHLSITRKHASSIQAFPYATALIWGTVMWLFRHHRAYLQPGLRASMEYLYNDSDKWDSFRNWIWHNK